MTPAVLRPESGGGGVGGDDCSNSRDNSGRSNMIRRAASGDEPRDTSLPCHDDDDDDEDDHDDVTSTTSVSVVAPPPLVGGRIVAPSPKSAETMALGLSQMAEAELAELYQDAQQYGPDRTHSFPVACRALLMEMDGNTRCIDCSKQTPEWGAVSYGAMVCLHCAGSHRGLGVTVSTVRSVTMDHWRYQEIVKMLEGGNRQLGQFFQRHLLGKDSVEFQSPHLTSQNVANMRYKTKAALFYRQQLDHHVQHLLEQGPYKGRNRRNGGGRTQRRPLGTQTSNLE